LTSFVIPGHRAEGAQESKKRTGAGSGIADHHDGLGPDGPVYRAASGLLDAEAQGKRTLEIDPSFFYGACLVVVGLHRRSIASRRRLRFWVRARSSPIRRGSMPWHTPTHRRADSRMRGSCSLVERAREEHGLDFIVASTYAALGDADRMTPRKHIRSERARCSCSRCILNLHRCEGMLGMRDLYREWVIASTRMLTYGTASPLKPL
jgi:hypothetical protein